MVRLVRRNGPESALAEIDPFLFYAEDNVAAKLGNTAVLAVPDTTPPTASALTINTVYTIGAAAHLLTVEYTDDQALNTASIDGSELVVTGPQAFSQAPVLIDTVSSNSGKTITATYQLTGPGGSWDGGDKYGEYTVSVVANKVADISGNTAVTGALGTFEHHGQITFTTTATNQIDPVVTTNDGSVIRWDLGTTANSLSVDAVEDNAPVFTYDNSGTKTIILEGRLNQIDSILFQNDGLSGAITGDIDQLTAIRTINLSNNSIAMDIAPLLLPTIQVLNVGGGQQKFTGTINSATAPTGLRQLRVDGGQQELTGRFDSADAPAGLTVLFLSGNKQTFTGQFDSATTPIGMLQLNLNGSLNQFTGTFNSADVPAGLRQIRLDGNLQQFTGTFNSADAPTGLTQLSFAGGLQQFTGTFNSADAPTGLIFLSFNGNLNQFTGTFNSADAPAPLQTLNMRGFLQQFTGTITSAGFNNCTSLSLGSPLNNFSGLTELANKPVRTFSLIDLPLSQTDIDAMFDAFIADTSLDLTSIDITRVPNTPSGTRIAALAARGVTITQ